MNVSTVDALLELLRGGAHASDGESLDLLQHMLQSAALLRERVPDDVELQLAGLVHDVGTVLEPFEPATHTTTGAAAVEPLLGPRVAALVAGHDQAKRYLVSSEPAYRAELSEMSLVTLTFQGGDMDAAERATFEESEHKDSLVQLRRADDTAKVAGRVVPDLEAWRTELERVALSSS